MPAPPPESEAAMVKILRMAVLLSHGEIKKAGRLFLSVFLLSGQHSSCALGYKCTKDWSFVKTFIFLNFLSFSLPARVFCAIGNNIGVMDCTASNPGMYQPWAGESLGKVVNRQERLYAANVPRMMRSCRDLKIVRLDFRLKDNRRGNSGCLFKK
jgi:hypothetical protein